MTTMIPKYDSYNKHCLSNTASCVKSCVNSQFQCNGPHFGI